MKKPLVVLFFVMISACKTGDIYKPIITQQLDQNECFIFEHPTKVFKIAIPVQWGKPEKVNHYPNIFTFYPSKSSQFTVSITQNLNLPKELPVKIMKMMFPQETPISQLERNRGFGWNSIRQDYQGTNNGNPRMWFAVFYGVGSNFIAITLSDSPENISNYKEVFDKTVNNIAFNTKLLEGK
ncbi:MAG: hypothetical protein A2252_11405 [Elusimicrobia bacterium RIFOXYA2_FULL_39_19]|nr:MAG: hypothetical protein A2252_11405 [Elusimicrobia bacterium RIFOXYA2_FULL_39_19]